MAKTWCATALFIFAFCWQGAAAQAATEPDPPTRTRWAFPLVCNPFHPVPVLETVGTGLDQTYRTRAPTTQEIEEQREDCADQAGPPEPAPDPVSPRWAANLRCKPFQPVPVLVREKPREIRKATPNEVAQQQLECALRAYREDNIADRPSVPIPGDYLRTIATDKDLEAAYFTWEPGPRRLGPRLIAPLADFYKICLYRGDDCETGDERQIYRVRITDWTLTSYRYQPSAQDQTIDPNKFQEHSFHWVIAACFDPYPDGACSNYAKPQPMQWPQLRLPVLVYPPNGDTWDGDQTMMVFEWEPVPRVQHFFCLARQISSCPEVPDFDPNADHGGGVVGAERGPADDTQGVHRSQVPFCWSQGSCHWSVARCEGTAFGFYVCTYRGTRVLNFANPP